jgi:hypothetical protein
MSTMNRKPAVQEVTGRWVDAGAEEPRWVSLKAERVQEPTVFATVTDETYCSAYELLFSHDQRVTFHLAELRTVITIEGAKTEKD